MFDCSLERLESKMESTKSTANYLEGEVPIECGLKESDFGGDGFPISVLSIQVWQRLWVKYNSITDRPSTSAPKWATFRQDIDERDKDLEWKLGFQNVLSWMISLELENILSSSIGLTKQFLNNFQNGIFTSPQQVADATGWRVKPIKNPRTLLRARSLQSGMGQSSKPPGHNVLEDLEENPILEEAANFRFGKESRYVAEMEDEIWSLKQQISNMKAQYENNEQNLLNQIRFKEEHLQANKRFLESQRSEQEADLEELKSVSEALIAERKKSQNLRLENQNITEELEESISKLNQETSSRIDLELRLEKNCEELSELRAKLCEANNEVCLLKSEIAKPLETVKEADSLKEQHQKKQSGNIKQTSDHKSIENLTSIQKQPSGGSTSKKNLLPDEVDHCQETEDIRIADLLEEIQILKEELRSKNQEIEHSQSFVEKYKKLRLKVKHLVRQGSKNNSSTPTSSCGGVVTSTSSEFYSVLAAAINPATAAKEETGCTSTLNESYEVSPASSVCDFECDSNARHDAQNLGLCGSISRQIKMEEKLRSIESEITLAEECSTKQTKDHLESEGRGEEGDIVIGRQQMEDLDEQERRTRIAFLQNRQAELETEIRFLRSSQLSHQQQRPQSEDKPAEMMNLTPPSTIKPMTCKLPFQVFNSSLSTDESTGPGSLNAAVTDGARIMESQVVNKTSKMLVTHALDMTAEQPVNSGQYSILTPFNRMIDIGLDAAKNLKEAAEASQLPRIGLESSPPSSTELGKDHFVAHVTLGGQQTIAAGSRKDDDKTSRNHHQHKRLIISKSVESADTVSKTLPVDETKIESAEEGFESLQMRDMISELQSAIKVERQQSLSWMEKHNKVRDALRLAAAEADDFKETIGKQGSEMSSMKQTIKKSKEDSDKMRDRVELLSSSVEQQKDEILQLSTLYKTERDATLALQKALSKEKENFNRLMSSLKNERIRSKQAGERDSDTIIDLRTALEVERELRVEQSASQHLAPSPPVHHTCWGSSCESRSSRPAAQQLYSSLSLGSLPTASSAFGHFAPFNEELREEESADDDQAEVRPSRTSRYVEQRKANCKRLERELQEERERVDALKSCLEQERDHRQSLEAELARSKKLSDPSIHHPEHKKPFYKRRLSSPQLHLHSQSTLGLNGPPMSPIQIQLQEEALIMERRRAETLKVDKMRIEYCLDQAKRKIQRMSHEIVNLRGRIQLHSQIKSDSPQYHQFYIHDLEAKLDAYRRREADLTEDIDSARKLVKKLQVENTDLFEREKRKVDDLREREDIDGEEEPNPEEDEDNEDSRPNLEFVPQANKHSNRAKSSPSSSKIGKLTALNESLNDQIRLLENRLMRIRQDHLEEMEAFKAATHQAPPIKQTPAQAIAEDSKQREKSLKLTRVTREKKALVWQKKYLTKLLYHMATSTSKHSSAGHSIDLEHQSGELKTNKFRVGALVVIGVLRLQTMANRWKQRVEKRKLSYDSTSSMFSTSQNSCKGGEMSSNGSSC